MKIKNKKITATILILLAATVFVSGCAQQPVGNETISDVKSDKDVANVVGDLSEDISNFTKELENIDRELG